MSHKNTARTSGSPYKDVPIKLQHGLSKDKELLDTMCNEFKNSEILRASMVRLILNNLRAKEAERESEINYTLPGYATHQADCNSAIRTCRKILKDCFGVDTFAKAEKEVPTK